MSTSGDGLGQAQEVRDLESGPLGTGHMYTWLFLVIVLFSFFDIVYFYVVLTLLELSLQSRPISNSQGSAYLSSS